MATPGYSIFELWQTAKKAKHIWNAFTDEFENAPSRVRELVETCDYLSRVLLDLSSLLDQFGETYPQEKSFDQKLRECQSFITRYWALKGDYLTELQNHRLGVGAKRTWKQAWQTARYAYEDKRAQELREGLSLEIQKLLAFTVVFALRRSTPINYLTLSSPRDRIGTHSPLPPRVDVSHDPNRPYALQDLDSVNLEHQLHGFQSLFDDLVGIRYSYEREMSSAVQGNRAPNIDPIRKRLESVWNQLCARSGFRGGNDIRPPFTARDLLEAPNQTYNQLLINAAAPSMHTGLRMSTYLRQPTQTMREPNPHDRSPPKPRPPSTYASSYAPSSSGGGRTSMTATSLYSVSTVTPRTTPYLGGGEKNISFISDSLLPKPAMSSASPCVATITIPGYDAEFKLSSWTIRTTSESRWVEWTTENSIEKLLHYLPAGAFPHVYHSKTSQRRDVTFDELNRVVLLSGQTTSYDDSILVEYTFESLDRRDEFQGDVRGMKHVKSFDFDVAWSNLHPKYDGWHKLAGMARLEELNLWQSHQFPYKHSLSFLASGTSGEQLEYPLLAFTRQQPLTLRSKEIQLDIAGNMDPGRRKRSSSSQKPRRRSSIFSWPRRSSENTTESLNDAPVSPTTQHANEPVHLGYICFQFTDKDGYNLFKKEYESAYTADTTSIEPRYPFDRAELANTQAPVELEAQFDPLELPI